MGMLASPSFREDPATSRRVSQVLILKFALAAALMGVLYGQVLVELALDWWNVPAWSQGMLIPPLAVYVAWLQRARTSAVPAAPDNRGVLLVGLACLIFLTGKLAAEFFLMRMSFVILLAGLLWAFWGTGRLRTLAFPLLLLATMVPLPVILYNALAAPLQLFASDVSARLAQQLGVTVFRDGNVIHLASTSLGVAEACSGLNSLSALIVASLLIGYLLCSRLRARIVVAALAIPLAIAVNLLRVTGTALIADYNQEFAMGFYHSFSGWAVFLVGFAVLYGFAKASHFLLD